MTQTYHRVVVEANEVPVWCNIAAAVAQWTILAGFFTFPGTFTSLKQSHALEHSQVVQTVDNVPLVVIAGVCYVVGAAGLCMLWSRFRSNYIWFLSHIPGILNCASGLLTVLLNVYSARDGTWLPTACVTLGIVVISLALMMSAAD
ncbi:hypothetical protein F5883DRAFT_441497 [Diaporthe sp. PMI_573]|nr:hypothetical protein F5883DRAFT_441497 [Diaporthaceae sp. PMI_573]